jgi:gliding motility-associated-like protein
MLKPLLLKLKYPILLGILIVFALTAVAQPKPVIATHPRIFLNAATKADLLVKKNANDVNWLSVLADAKKYLPGKVIEWNETTASDSKYYGGPDIFYSYCGSSWEEAAITLGLAHQLTKTNKAGANPTAYSNKLLLLADVMTKAYKDFPPNENYKPNIFQFNSSYATRHVGKTIAIIYDWCYDELGAKRKAEVLKMMKDWYVFMSTKPYRLNQLQDDPTGNYFMGHVICSGYMGLAIGSDDVLSKKMLDFARQRLLGTPGSLNTNTTTSAECANAYFTQSVKGGLPTAASKAYLGPKYITAAPQQDGIPVQGWSYGGETSNFLIDYVMAVKSATGESMIQSDAAFRQFFAKNSEAIVHSYTPNRFQWDNSNDNGSFVGCTAARGLPLRLSTLLEGTPEGAKVEYFYKTLMQPVNLISGNKGYPELSWENLLYGKKRVATAFTYKPYYPVITVNVYKAVPKNTSLNKFYLRKDWSKTATWATVDMGIGVYDQHNHNNAGHFKIIKGDSHDGDDHLLVGANEVAHNGGNGIDGATNYSYSSSFSNTLFIDDFNDYDTPYPEKASNVGGQSSGGYDEPTNLEQNDNFSYFRADLTSAYLVSYDNPDTTKRTVRYYYRSLLYLRNSDVFVTYDKFLMKNSTNKLGQYKKHLRWHFMHKPVVTGNNLTATMDNSKLFVHTVIPAAINIASVDESKNPDNNFDSDLGYMFNTGTWRAEISAANNPLKQDILTVLQPGLKTAKEMKTTAIKTTKSNMEGSIIEVNGNTEVVLFNSNVSKYLVPVTTAAYAFAGSIDATHTLCGVDPGQLYKVTYAGSVVTVTKSASGTEKASPSGVLTFKLKSTATQTQTITFVPVTKIYGSADFSPATVTSALPVNYASSDIKVASVVSGKLHILKAGKTTITASQPGDAVYKPAANVIQTLTVTKAALKITADNKTKKAGTANPVLTATITGFVNGDDKNDLLSQPKLTTTAIASSKAGSYPITATGATSDNYTVTYATGKLVISASATNSFEKPGETTVQPVIRQAMSPNGDGINDVLIIDGISNYPDNKLIVMDKNGASIYEAPGYDNSGKAFDGHAAKTGAKQMPGTYFYRLEYKDKGELKHLNGYFIIKY